MTSPRRLFRIAVLALAVGLFAPSPAYACVWNTAHKGSPLPPCKQEDIPGFRRIMQMNAQLLGKIFAATGKIIWVKQEIKQWQSAHRQATRFRDQMERKFGRLTENPLPSLVAEYNRRSPLAKYIALNYDEKYLLAVSPLNVPHVADSIYTAFQDSFNISRLYGTAKMTASDIKYGTQYRLRNTEKNLSALMDRRKFMEEFSDSLQEKAEEYSERYAAGREVKSSLAESQIELLSAQLNRLHGTAFEGEAAAINSRLEAYNSAVRTNSRNAARNLRSRIIPF